MSLDAYSFSRIQDVHSCGALVISEEAQDLGGVLFLIRATLAFGRTYDAVLTLREVLEAQPGGAVHRLEYSYQLLYRTQFLFRYDRDPENHPEMPEHKHLPPDERRIAWKRVTFRQVVEEVYDIVGEIEGA
jgi:hypothetical protein